MTIIDKIAWVHLNEGALLSSRSRGRDVFYIPAARTSRRDHLHKTTHLH
jgi:8-oxo-dGTP diphosphatase